MQLRRYLQFRLRTLLIVATLLCVVLALIYLPARRKWQAVRELQERNMGVWFESDPSPWQRWSRDRLGCDWGPPVGGIVWRRGDALKDRDRRLIATCQPRELYLHAGQLPAERDLAWLARLRSLRNLWLGGSPTEAQLRSLQAAPHLEELDIHALWSDAEWRALASLTQVRRLYLRNVLPSTGGMPQLATMRHLQELDFYFSSMPLTDEQLTQLRAALPGCQISTFP